MWCEYLPVNLVGVPRRIAMTSSWSVPKSSAITGTPTVPLFHITFRDTGHRRTSEQKFEAREVFEDSTTRSQSNPTSW